MKDYSIVIGICWLADQWSKLFSILQPFASRRLNLTKIESRPTKRRPWEYVNFLDFEGHSETENVRDVLAEVRERCQFLKILGSYPAA